MAFLQSASAQQKEIAFNDPNLYYQGRILYRDSAAELSWPGTSITINFKGTSISAVMKDSDTANYYNVIVDRKYITKIHTDPVKQTYVLAKKLKNKKHSVQLFKRTEWDKGKTWFYGFAIPAASKIFKPVYPPKRKIEFYGNSITCGYAMEDSSGKDSPFGYFENNYLSYAAIAARHFHAEYACVSKSGIGVMVSWFPLIMPEMYDRLDPMDSTSKWDFENYTPQVVVINLFQNDSWIVKLPTNEQFKSRFGSDAPGEKFIIDCYEKLVVSIRNKYPAASIICALGNMDATKQGSPWPGYVKEAVAEMHDPKIYTLFFDYKNTPGHPKVAEQRTMADSLIDFIQKNITW